MNHLMIDGPRLPLAVRIDSTHTVLYVRMSRATIARTVEVQEEVLADCDSAGKLVGFEVIGFEAPQRRAQVPGTLREPSEGWKGDAESYELEAALT